MNGSMFSESDFIPSQIREWYFSTQIAYGVGFMGNFVWLTKRIGPRRLASKNLDRSYLKHRFFGRQSTVTEWRFNFFRLLTRTDTGSKDLILLPMCTWNVKSSQCVHYSLSLVLSYSPTIIVSLGNAGFTVRTLTRLTASVSGMLIHVRGDIFGPMLSKWIDWNSNMISFVSILKPLEKNIRPDVLPS